MKNKPGIVLLLITLLSAHNIYAEPIDSIHIYLNELTQNHKEKRDKSEKTAFRILNLLKSQPNSYIEAKTYYYLGEIAYEKENYHTSVKYLLNAVSGFQSQDTVTHILAETYLSLGSTYNCIDQYHKAFENYEKAYTLSKKIYHEELAYRSQLNMGQQVSMMGDYTKAEVYLKEALAYYSNTNDSMLIGHIYFSLGVNASKAYKQEEALKYYKNALTIYNQFNDKTMKASILNNIGLVYSRGGRYNIAIEYYKKALVELGLADYKRGIAICLSNIGDLYFLKGEFENARKYSEQAIELGHLIGSPDILKDAYFRMSEIQYETSEFQQAYLSYALYNKFKDSVYHATKMKQLEHLKAEFDNTRKEERIAYLELQNKVEQSNKRKVSIILFFSTILTVLIISVLISLFRIKVRHNRRLKVEINERRKVESEMKELTEKLDNRVKERTFELRIAKEQAEESERLKTSFLANMSHEVRTPMNGILGFSELLGNQSISDDKRMKYIKLIHKNSKVLLNLIEDIIDISKIESGELSVNKTIFTLNELLFELFSYAKNQRSQLSKKEIDLQLKLPDNSSELKLFTDSARVQQVYTNLINNALKFTLKGNISIGYHLNAPNHITFFVEDTGIGISPKNQELVFQRFRQIDESNKRRFGGTGLGLYLSKQIIELMDGNITINSEEGKGTRIEFTMKKNDVIINEENISTQKLDKLKNKKILIAEDNEINYEVINHMLNSKELLVYWAKNGKEAVEMFKQHHFHAILMDIQMPVMNGIEAIAEIRNNNKHIPIIVFTAYGLNRNKEECFNAGCNDFLVKPVNQKVLFELLLKYIKV